MGIFGKREWQLLPDSFVQQVKQKLGTDKFTSLTDLSRRYKLFKQMAENATLFGADHEAALNQVAAFLTSVGNDLGRQGVTQDPQFLDDAISVFQITLAIKPDNIAARASLVMTLHGVGRSKEAKREAQQTISDMNKLTNLPLPMQQASEEMRSVMLSILDGTL